MSTKHSSEFVSRQHGDPPIVNYISFMLGLVISLTALLLLINRFFVSNRIEQVLATDINETLAAEDSKGVALNNIEMILESGSKKQLQRLQEQLLSSNQKASIGQQVLQGRQRVKIADRLFQFSLDSDLRDETILSKLDALGVIYGFDFIGNLGMPEIANRFLEFAREQQDSTNHEIAREASLAVAKVVSHEIVKDARNNRTVHPEEVADILRELIHKYPDDAMVLNQIQLMIASVFKLAPEIGVEVRQAIIDSPNQPDAAPVRRLLEDLQDSQLLDEVKFQQAYKNRDLYTKQEEESFAELLVELATNSTGFKKSIYSVAQGADWLEAVDRVDLARSVYQALVDSSAQRSHQESVELAGRIGRNGLKRCALIGQPLQFHGLEFKHAGALSPLDPGQFENRVAVLMFWSVEDNSSLKALTQLNKLINVQHQKNMVVLAVCLDSQLEEMQLQVARSLSEYIFVICPEAGTRKPTIVEQCPVHRLPKIVVVDSSGIVRKLNVPLKELSTAVELVR